jgi:hypothetical protein
LNLTKLVVISLKNFGLYMLVGFTVGGISGALDEGLLRTIMSYVAFALVIVGAVLFQVDRARRMEHDRRDK